MVSYYYTIASLWSQTTFVVFQWFRIITQLPFCGLKPLSLFFSGFVLLHYSLFVVSNHIPRFSVVSYYYTIACLWSHSITFVFQWSRIITLIPFCGLMSLCLFFSGLVPLHNACSYGHYEVTELLVKYGASVNVADLWKFTPLHEAAAKGKYEIVRLLLKVHTLYYLRINPSSKADK